jgi:predicted ArsR family transcriptional regulator
MSTAKKLSSIDVILKALGKKPISTLNLAKKTGLSPCTVLRALESIYTQGTGPVKCVLAEPNGLRGRPTRLWSLR